MKIGIVTWFRHENFGTALQAIALQKFLRNNGYEVELINFHVYDGYKANKKIKATYKVYHFLSRVIYHCEKIRYRKLFEKKSKKFKQIIIDNCNISKEIHSDKEYIELCNNYDFIIFGSDQIWNPNWYHPYYYANFDKIHTTLIAYAPSFGVKELLPDKIENIKNALERFGNIALREEQGCKIVENILNKSVSTVLDPTFLLEKAEWEKFEEKIDIESEKYLLCYFLSDNSRHWKAAKEYARRKKLKLVIIPKDGFSYIKSKNVIRDCSVGNFISLIKNAEFIITDSFHGSIFSIIFNKQFILFERHNPNDIDEQNSRLYNLLDIIDEKKHLMKYNTMVIEKVDEIKYEKVNKIINEKINNSKEYLLKSLKREE